MPSGDANITSKLNLLCHDAAPNMAISDPISPDHKLFALM